jgi:RsiW-degrading membrane proteinase PrsW (M82 family)
MNNYLILLGLAIAPGLAIAYYIFWQDKYDREPLPLIIKSFFLGVVSIIPAIILELLFQTLGLQNSSTNIVEGLIACIVGIGLMEEGSKYFFTRRFD